MLQVTGSSLTCRGSLPWKDLSRQGWHYLLLSSMLTPVTATLWCQPWLRNHTEQFCSVAQGSGLVMLEMHVSWPCGHGLVRISSPRPKALERLYDGSWPLAVPVPFFVLSLRWLSSELLRNTHCWCGVALIVLSGSLSGSPTLPPSALPNPELQDSREKEESEDRR